MSAMLLDLGSVESALPEESTSRQKLKIARELAETVDRDRAAFIKKYFGLEWPSRHLFHLMVNSGIGEDVAVETILDTAARFAEQRT
jgi:hypothetical protein